MTENERALAEKLFAVFDKLRDGDFPESGTSQILKSKDADFFLQRADEEFTELAGVIDGSHRHSDDFETDFLLESSQVFYWLALAAVAQRKSFSEFLRDSAAMLDQLEKLHTENKIPFSKVFEKDLQECEEKGYLV
ncbi:MAG: hypothetical protein K9L85_03835 [Candidatus Peribacteraceae bacterium]|nr:hypothetical protein [Candidatus Peribacteraceae bacterium]